ncbi:ABC transporter substrate-binding protein [Aureibacillus halotolerans]|uniref:Putative spermidine/putrescine transport system substrate-binding protein n=1 Tax=Aureibacillus halotolerans TaxID=1508390 RepID=A0A4R6UCK4_9BACI|nr:ABC transporter substrate-binding protein [Aureibacillus halotolerans]TDQ42843.1 putative spermidine/putrescine transport system substrate-binding protein [Aureibacillus halotolerans]
MKKGLIAGVLAASVLAGCGTSSGDGATGSEDKKELVVSTWGFASEFFEENVYKPFEEEHNVDIVVEIGNNADRLNKVRQGSTPVDVIFLSDYYANQGIADGLFAEVDREKLTNVESIYDVAQAPLGEKYGPAYTIARFGIAYDTEAVDSEITSWSDLWNPELAGKLTLPGITTTAGPMMLDAASLVGGAPEFNEDVAIQKASELNDSVVKYYGKTSELVNMFGRGEVAVGPVMEMYLADLQEAVPSVEFVSPEEGAYAVMNTVNIVESSDNQELANEFINWMLSKEVQTASAKNKIDSPVNTQVELTDEEAAGLTYGKDVVESLRSLDMENVNANMKNWIDRWNREVAR